eukprot:3711123-Ditylum_brightwellii.AAC.1
MSTVDGRVLVECAGLSYGVSSSFQAATYRLLSATSFIHKMLTYTMEQLTWVINIYVDNKRVIKQHQHQLTYAYDYSHHTLEPDWDIIAQTIQAGKPYQKA